MGIVHIDLEKVTSRGYFIYLRPRGSERVLPSEVRFLHQHCLFDHYERKLAPIDMGPWWVPQISGVRA